MESDQIRQINALFTEWDTTTSPGCALAIIKNGKIIFKNGLRYCKPGTSDNQQTFQCILYSINFQTICRLLHRSTWQNKESYPLEDDVRRYIPELPDYGQTITISHMIHHTSGLRDFLELNYISGRNFDELITDEDAMDLITRQRGTEFFSR